MTDMKNITGIVRNIRTALQSLPQRIFQWGGLCLTPTPYESGG